jgi:hypothetical protein
VFVDIPDKPKHRHSFASTRNDCKHVSNRSKSG